MEAQLAWIGLGNMGRLPLCDIDLHKTYLGMSKNLVEKGNLSKPLILYNRTTQRAKDLNDKLPSGKSVVSTSLEEAVAKADIIFTCLINDDAMKETYSQAISGGSVKGKLFVDCSTIHPDTTTMLAEKLEAQGAKFVACPVFGAPAMADNGQLVCVLAGPAASVEQVKPYCKGVMGRAIIDYSDQAPAKATLLKITGNTFIIHMIEALSEGHTMAEKTGLGNDNLHQFIEAMFPGPYVAYSNRMMSGDYYNREAPLFSASGARKDARHAMNLAEKNGAKLKGLEVADAHLAVVEKERGEKGDIAGIYGAVRKEAGLDFGNGK